MVVSAVYVMDNKGKIIINRNYRGDVSYKVAEIFANKVTETDESDEKPVFTIDGITYVYIKYNGLYLLAVTKKNANVTIMIMFLYKLIDVFKHYFGELNEESIRDNFVILYELFDEMMDYGYPQISDGKVLKEYITQEGNRTEKNSRPPATVTNVVSWRSEGIVHRKNEIFLDVVESLNLLVSSTGTVLHSEIIGAVKMKSYLSGMPELKLGLNDKMMFESSGKSSRSGKAVEMEDIRFHQCVRLSRFENDRTISFIPPDGEFELMTYRLNTHVKPLIWVEAVVESHGTRVEYMIKAKSQFKTKSIANGVKIKIPVPVDVAAPTFKSGAGSVSYAPDEDCVIWHIKQFYGNREYLMRAQFSLPSITSEEAKIVKPITVKFEIPYFTVSGIQVRYLKIIEKSGYKALPWVRYITVNGDYQLRMT